MYWRAEVLTKTGKELSLHLEGPKDHVLADLQMGDLTVITMTPDMVMALKKICTKGLIPSSTLGPFFIDFSRMLQSGLSINETARTLGETTADLQIKTALKSLLVSLNDGHSLKTAFENTKVFPHIVPMLLDAAERSGQIPEVSKKIGEYFEYLNENTNKVIGSFIYPIAVFIVLTVASIVVSMNLIPQLGFLLSDDQKHSVSMKILTGYAYFMKNNWRMLILGFPVLAAGLTYAWRLQKDGFLEYVFNIPIVGNMFKEIEFTHLFLKLFIYIKSGISITEALSHIQSTQKTFVTNKLVGIKNRINSGHSLGEAFEKDGFFPPFLCQSLKKADETGKRTEYFYEIYKYYDSKSKASVQAMIKLINPLLMSLAFAFAGFIASFYVLIYRNMAVMSSSLYS